MTWIETWPAPDASVAEWAYYYLSRKWRPILVEREEEGPKNIGLVLGEPSSGGLVVVEVDDTMGTVTLPLTDLHSWRTGMTRTCHWYVSTASRSVTFQDPLWRDDAPADTAKTRVLVELRSTGVQLVAPSIHPSERRDMWSLPGEPAAVDPAVLQRGVALIASCALLVRYWPRAGSREEFTRSLAGLLLRGGLTPREARGIVQGAAGTTGGAEAKKHDHVGVRDEEIRHRVAVEANRHGLMVEDLDRRLAAGEPVTDGPRLVDLLPEGGGTILDALTEWLQLRPGGRPRRQAATLIEPGGPPG
jgi:hypothetical protein